MMRPRKAPALRQSTVVRRATHVVVAHNGSALAAQQIVALLEQIGYRCSCSHGGTSALLRVRASTGLRMLLCLHTDLGDMDAKVLVEQLRDIGGVRVPVAVIAPKQLRDEYVALGAHVLHRPLDKRELSGLWTLSVPGMLFGYARAEMQHGKTLVKERNVQGQLHDFWTRGVQYTTAGARRGLREVADRPLGPIAIESRASPTVEDCQDFVRAVIERRKK